jgi:hypothetical protein
MAVNAMAWIRELKVLGCAYTLVCTTLGCTVLLRSEMSIPYQCYLWYQCYAVQWSITVIAASLFSVLCRLVSNCLLLLLLTTGYAYCCSFRHILAVVLPTHNQPSL